MAKPKPIRGKDTKFIALHLPKHLSDFLDVESKKNYRNKSQQVLAIIDEYFKRSFEKKNLPQKIEYMKEQYQNKEKVNDLTNKILDTDCDIEAKTIGTEDGSTN